MSSACSSHWLKTPACMFRDRNIRRKRADVTALNNNTDVYTHELLQAYENIERINKRIFYSDARALSYKLKHGTHVDHIVECVLCARAFDFAVKLVNAKYRAVMYARTLLHRLVNDCSNLTVTSAKLNIAKEHATSRWLRDPSATLEQCLLESRIRPAVAANMCEHIDRALASIIEGIETTDSPLYASQLLNAIVTQLQDVRERIFEYY